MMKFISVLFLVILSMALCAQPIPVTVSTNANGFVLLRNGSPYFIKGAGGDAFPERLKEYGGNSIRTWGTDANTIILLDKAHQLGLTVTMGLWVGHQAHGFDYNNTAAVQAQLEEFREWVRRYKDHPAVLAWGIGNEVELGTSASVFNKKVWNAINDIAAMIHQEDGNHPTLTITAGIDVDKAKDIIQRAPELDMLGVNSYGGIGGVANTLNAASWQKPYVITEWGPNGPWEVNRTSWGAALEQTSTEKAALYKSRYENAILGNPGKCLGSYVFLWANKMEETPTWFGLFMPTLAGEETEVVDVMHYVWSGAWPGNRAPKITTALINSKSAGQSPILTNDVGNIATISATDPDGDPLTYEFLFRPETGTVGITKIPPATIEYLPGLIDQQSGSSITFRAHSNLQNYRLFIFVRDNHNNVATANIPFRVALEPMVSTNPNIIFPSIDAYVRAGSFADERFGASDHQRLLTRLDVGNPSNVREAYLGFNIGSINKGIDNVILKVYGSSAQEVKTSVLGIRNNSWGENQISWTTRPIPASHESTALDTALIKENTIAYHEWDVTGFVNLAHFEKIDFVTFILRDISPSDNPTQWQSRETRPNPPALAFTLNDGDIILSADEEPTTVSIYPNPFSKTIFINTIKGNPLRNVKIFSLEGRLLLTKVFDLENTELTVEESLTTGFYVLQIEMKDGNICHRKIFKD
jgi:hypothetical protein